MQGNRKLNLTLMATAAALTGVFALSAVKPAEAQRKSIRWTTSSVDSYGYKVAASMTKIVEEALGGEYTVTVNPYPSTTSAMKAVMDGDGEIGYTADIGMTEFYDANGGFKDYKPPRAELVHTWYAYPMESFMATSAASADEVQVLEGLQRQAGVLHPGRLHELAELPAHLQDARLRLQARPDRSEDAVRRAAGRHHRRLGRLHDVRLARWRRTGRRPRSAWTSRSSIRARTRSPSSRPPAWRSSTSIRRARSPRTSA